MCLISYKVSIFLVRIFYEVLLERICNSGTLFLLKQKLHTIISLFKQLQSVHFKVVYRISPISLLDHTTLKTSKQFNVNVDQQAKDNKKFREQA